MAKGELPQVDVAFEDADLQQFLLYLGSGLTASGEAVNEIQSRLHYVAAVYGAPHARFAVLPTFVVVSLDPSAPVTLEPTHQLRGVLRLDQISAIFEVLKRAERGELAPLDGIAEIDRAIAMHPRFSWPVVIIGHVVLTVGICLVLQPTTGDLVLSALFGALVGFMKLFAARWPRAQMVLPVAAAFVVSTITFLLTEQGWADADLRAMVAPLVTFLPGAALTMAVVELSAAELIAGASRLVAGSLQMVLLAFGIIAATQAVGLPSTESLEAASTDLLGWWAPWLGVFVFGVGIYLHNSAPKGTLWWLLLVLVTARVGQQVGDELFGGYASAFVGALAMTPMARAIERTRTGPPTLVTFLPAFWLLVPGALGLIGVTEYLSNSANVGIQDFVGAIGATMSIALGVLVGYPLVGSVASAYEKASAKIAGIPWSGGHT